MDRQRQHLDQQGLDLEGVRHLDEGSRRQLAAGQQFFGIQNTNGGKVAIFAGGIPLSRDGVVVGAIGVSGGSGEQDHSVAEAGVAGF